MTPQPNGNNGKGGNPLPPFPLLDLAPNEPMKRCCKCGEWKPATTEYFYADRRKKDGLRSGLCKACDKLYNGERNRARFREYSRRNRAKKTVYTRQWRANHPEKDRLYTKAYRERHPEKVKEQNSRSGQAYRERHPEKVKECQRRYRQKQRLLKPPKPEKPAKLAKPVKLPKPARIVLPKPPKPARPKVVKPPKPVKPPVVLAPDLERHITSFLNAKALKKPKTLAYYRDTLKLYSEYLVQTGLEQWSSEPETIADNINAFLGAARLRGCKDITLDHYYRALCTWLKWLGKRKRIEGDVVDLIERPPRVVPLPKVAKVDDIARLLETLEQAAPESWLNLRDYALLTLALDSGARIGELVGLTLEKLDIEQRTIAATDTKSGVDRTILFSENAAGPLAKWLLVRAGLDLPADLTAVFVGYVNVIRAYQGLTDSGMRQRLKKWQQQAGIAHFNFHRLRHSYAVYTLRALGNILDVQKQMGHSDIATTARYLLVDDEERGERHDSHNPLDYLKKRAGKNGEAKGGQK